MKKQYLKPSMEAVEINDSAQFLTVSDVKSVNSGDVFDGTITGGSGSGRAPEFSEIEELLFGQ